MMDCIRSLLTNCSHLKEFFILKWKNITFHYQSYLKKYLKNIYIYIYIIEDFDSGMTFRYN